MPDFEWSPEAIEHIAQRFHESYERQAPEHSYKTREASAVPWVDVPEDNQNLMCAVVRDLLTQGVVVALPPCPTCNGHGYYIADTDVSCPACNGSGVERMVPLSEIVAWLENGQADVADAIRVEFGGKHAD